MIIVPDSPRDSYDVVGEVERGRDDEHSGDYEEDEICDSNTR